MRKYLILSKKKCCSDSQYFVYWRPDGPKEAKTYFGRQNQRVNSDASRGTRGRQSLSRNECRAPVYKFMTFWRTPKKNKLEILKTDYPSEQAPGYSPVFLTDF